MLQSWRTGLYRACNGRPVRSASLPVSPLALTIGCVSIHSRHAAPGTACDPLPPDGYEVRLVAEFVLDEESSLPLDGEVQDPADPESLPSGDGKPGGDAYLEFKGE